MLLAAAAQVTDKHRRLREQGPSLPVPQSERTQTKNTQHSQVSMSKRSADGSVKSETPTAASTTFHANKAPDLRKKCPYLDSIRRQYLDFDKPKTCSITLSTDNVYVCLICGQFFQGRGKHTPCYTHACQMGHHVFMKMTGFGKGDIYCLPDNYKVVDSSLTDIQTALAPNYSSDQISSLDKNKTLSTDVSGTTYLPGFIGMNNLNHTDFINTCVMALAQVPPIRDFFLKKDNYQNCESRLVVRFGDLISKIWSRGNYRNAVSPHDFVQEVTVASKRRFVIGQQSEAVEFMQWLLNALSKDLFGIKKRSTKILKPFQGLIEVKTEKKVNKDETDEANWETKEMPFLFLALDLPPVPLFKDAQGGNVVPQIPLSDVLTKFDGETITDKIRAGVRERKKYRIKKLPDFLIFHLGRFTKNNWFVEKNPTVVNFPVKSLDLQEISFLEEQKIPTADEAREMKISDLKALITKHKVSTKGCVEKADLIAKYNEVLAKQEDLAQTKFDLLANVCHDSPAERENVNAEPLQEGSYKVHVQNKAIEQWYEIQDLFVEDTLPQLVGVSESYMLIYERQKSATTAAAKKAAALQAELYGK